MNPSSPSPLDQHSPPSGIFSGPPYVHVPHSHKGLVRAIVILIVVAILGGIGYWVYGQYFSPAAQAKSSSDKYISALTTDNVDWAAYLSAKDADFSLLESAAQAVKGSYKLTSSTEKNGNYYFLYALTNPNNKQARTIVTKTAKGYRINSFVYSGDALALIPGEPVTPGSVAAKVPSKSPVNNDSTQSISPSVSPSKPGSSTGSTGGTVTVVCLSQANYGAVFADGALDPDVKWTKENPYTTTIGFGESTADYVDEFEAGDVYASWVKFFATYPSKNYTFHVTGTYTGDMPLASERARRVAEALTNVGISQSKIVTDKPIQLNESEAEDSDGYVSLSIIPGSGC